MTLRIDQFYLDDSYGVIKFLGRLDGRLLFEKFEKGFVKSGRYSGWLKTGTRVNIDEPFQLKRMEAGKVRPIPPPE